MIKSILCSIGFHNWEYEAESLRECKSCSKKEWHYFIRYHFINGNSFNAISCWRNYDN